jgi:hypothetical protein
MIYLLCHPRCLCFIPFLQNFEYILNKNGIRSEFVLSYDPKKDSGKHLWIVIWNQLEVLPRKCIIYNMDPMVSHIESGLKSLIYRSPRSKIIKLVDYCYGLNQTKLTDIKIPYSVLTYGYSPYHKFLKSSILKSDVKQDIDILFYGNVSERRIPMIMELANLCKQKNYKFMVRNYNLFDESEKVITIARAKIVVSFASNDTKLFHGNDLARSSQVISSGGFVITEYIGDETVESKMSEYVPHYKTVDELVSKVDYYLQNPDERDKLIALASEKFPQQFNLEKDLISLISDAI